MDLIKTLAGVGVSLTTDDASIRFSSYVRNDAHPFRMRRQSISHGKLLPSVSCLMVTRGDRWTIKYALECYRRQTYANRELIIAVNENNYEAVSALLKESPVDCVNILPVDRGLTLGDCRNMAVARTHGEILIQWDDDDLYDPLRIAASVTALTKTPSAAALLSRWLIWWPSRDLAAISGPRIWEGSIAVWREHLPVYPSINRGEDTFVSECIANTRDITVIDAPLIYVYVIREDNTFQLDHHEEIIERSDYVFRGGEYMDLINILSERMPILEYGSEKRNRAAT